MGWQEVTLRDSRQVRRDAGKDTCSEDSEDHVGDSLN